MSFNCILFIFVLFCFLFLFLFFCFSGNVEHILKLADEYQVKGVLIKSLHQMP